MAIAPTYPGVYIQELPSGVRTITGVATSITAFVGYTAKGPLDRATRITSFSDYERSFGGIHKDSPTSYAAQQFYLNGGSDAYVVRVAKDHATASIELRFGSGAGDVALVVSAANPGNWGNSLRLEIDYATSEPDSTFNLAATLFQLQAGELAVVDTELFRNLSMNSRSAAYAPNVLGASKLVRAERPAGLTFDDAQRGFSLSGELDPFPALTTEDRVIAGVLDGSTNFNLTLTDAVPNSMATLITRLTAAIASAGLDDRLEAVRANAQGADSGAGNFLKLRSKLLGSNPNSATEFSSVRVETAPDNDLAENLGLGLARGGREVDGAGFRRPLPSGTRSAELADIVGDNVNGDLEVTINDNTASPATAIVATTTVTLAATAVGPELATALQDLIRSIPNPAAARTRVTFAGTFLQVISSAETPNASVSFGGAGGTATRLSGAGSFVNTQQAALGVGVDFGAQGDAVGGRDGVPPEAGQLIGSQSGKSGMNALLDVDLFNLLCIPDTTMLGENEAASVIQAGVGLCEDRRAFYIVDPPPTRTLADVATWSSAVSTSKNSAVYFPAIDVADPLDRFRSRAMPASGALAGIYSRTDAERGVWKAPAGVEATIRGVRGVSLNLTDAENGQLNPKGVNVLRTFATFGTVVWGARTMQGADQQPSDWRYVPVRRLALFIEETLFRGTKWVVFEPNDEPLWAQIRLNVGAFMQNLFRQGAFQGTSPREAYFVKCDKETTTQNDINLGIVNILVGFAPLKPAEFVIISIQQMAGQVAT